MKKFKLLLNFVYFSNLKLLDRSKHILASLAPRPALASAIEIPFYDDLLSATNDFEEAIEKSKNGDRIEISKRNDIRTILLEYLLQIKSFLEMNYANNYTALVSSGYDVQKERTPIGDLPAPTSILLTSAHEGCVLVNIKAVKGAKMYVIEYGLANEETTQQIVSSKSTFKITGLQSAAIYRVRAAAIGTHQNRNFIQYKNIVVS